MKKWIAAMRCYVASKLGDEVYVTDELMATNPTWADGLPLAAAGFEAYRYRKD